MSNYLRTIVTVFLVMFSIGNITAQDIYVDASAPDGGDGSSWSTAYKNLHTAIDSAQGFSGKTFHIAKGTYRTHAPGSPADSRVRHSTEGTLSFRGGYPSGGGTANPGQNTTILTGDLDGDCNGEGDQRTMIEVVGTQKSTLELHGIVIEHTWGILSAEAAIAVSGRFSKLRIDECVFRETRGVSGGAINLRALRDGLVEIKNSSFESNKAERGAAIFASVGTHSNGPNLRIENSQFVGNEASNNSAVFSFAGLFRTSYIRGCLFERNTSAGNSSVMDFARFAGGLEVSRSVFYNNVGDGEGALMYLQGEKVGTKAKFLNCLFLENDNAAANATVRVNAHVQARFINCTFHGNNATKGSPIFVYATGKGFSKIPANSSLLIQNGLFTDNNLGDLGAIYTSIKGIDTLANMVQGKQGSVPSELLYVNVGNPRGSDKTWGTADDGLNLVDGGVASGTGVASTLFDATSLDLALEPMDLTSPSIGAYGSSVGFLPTILSVEASAPTSCEEPNGAVVVTTNIGLGSEVTLTFNGQSYNETIDGSGTVTIPDLVGGTAIQNLSIAYNGIATEEINLLEVPVLEPPVIADITTEAASYTEAEAGCSGSGDGVIHMTFDNLEDGSYKITYVDEDGVDREFTKVAVKDGLASLKGVGAGTYADMRIKAEGCISEPRSTVVLEE